MSKPIQLGIVVALLAAAAMWCYVDRVLVPYQREQSAARGIPRGNLSDLYPRWVGARELWLHGRDPYSPEVTREIQQGYYGRALDPARPNDPKDQQGFAYPVFVVFLLAPTVRMPFEIVQTGFRWLLIACVVVSIPLWFRAVGQRWSTGKVILWIILALGSFPAVQGVKLQQLSLLVCALLAWAFAALAGGHLVLAGVLLAIATIKPQLVGIACVWLLLWCTGDWRARRTLFRGFATTMIILLAASNFLLPGWISRFRTAAAEYVRYTGGGKSLLDVLLTPSGGKAATVAVIVSLAVMVWKLRRASVNTPEFALSLAAVMAGTLVVVPTYAPYNQLLLLPALIFIFGEFGALWNAGRALRAALVIMSVALVWPWLAAAVLDLALLVAPAPRVQTAWSLPLFTTLVIPLAVLSVVGVFAVGKLRQRPGSA